MDPQDAKARRRAFERHLRHKGRRIHFGRDEQKPGSQRGIQRLVRDLDEIDRATGEPKLYRSLLSAALARGVARAHHVLHYARNGWLVGGHRMQLETDYQRERGVIIFSGCKLSRRAVAEYIPPRH